MRRNQMTEKEKMYFFSLLFPILWPLVFAMAICDLVEAIKKTYQRWWYK